MQDTNIPTGERVRARSWKEYVGQRGLQRRLHTHIGAAIEEDRPLDHMLLAAPPGSGKTTLARLIALAMGHEFIELMMPIKMPQFLEILAECRGKVVILLDEIHRAPKAFMESLLSIEQGYIQTETGERISTRDITFICATTEPGKLPKPLWDRLLIKPQWEDYSDEDMAEIVVGMARRAGITMTDELAAGLAPATAGTPRIAGSLVVAARDLGVTNQPVTVESVLELAGIDCDGLSDQHLEYLASLHALGGQSGLANICTMMQLSTGVIQDLERLLIKRRFVKLESAGRRLTMAGRAKLPESVRERRAS